MAQAVKKCRLTRAVVADESAFKLERGRRGTYTRSGGLTHALAGAAEKPGAWGTAMKGRPLTDCTPPASTS